VKVIRRGSSAVGELASVGKVHEDERHNQARHLGDNHFSFPAVDIESDQHGRVVVHGPRRWRIKESVDVSYRFVRRRSLLKEN